MLQSNIEFPGHMAMAASIGFRRSNDTSATIKVNRTRN